MLCYVAEKKVFIIIFFVTIFMTYISIYYLSCLTNLVVSSNNNPKITQNNVIDNSTSYSSNYAYLINNNVAQYSSYIIIDNNKENRIYRIEALIKINYKYIRDDGEKENFSCLIKFPHRVIQLDLAIDSPQLTTNSVKKLIYQFNLDHEYKENYLNDALIAIIWKSDFDKNLTMTRFLSNLKAKNLKQLVLPYSLIKFQKPSLIHTAEPRLPGVSYCVHYTYAVPPQIFDWFDRHLSFGASKIIIYDAIENQTLTKILKDRYNDDERISVLPYQIDLNSICDQRVIFEQYTELSCPPEAIKYLIKFCEEFFQKEFLKKIIHRNRHEPLTVNDCFTILKEKYEFIAHYDIDEFIYPRSLDSVKYIEGINSSVSCESKSSICSSRPFINNYESNEVDFKSNISIYNYVLYLINTHKEGRNIENLGSIRFQHGLLIIPNEKQLKLMNDLRDLINKIDNGTAAFPLELQYENHVFLVQKQNSDYIKYLSMSYTKIIDCINSEYLQHINNIDKSLLRYTYYITEGSERMGKSIHYYKNVKSIWIHGLKSAADNLWNFSPLPYNVHFLSHYRGNPKFGKNKFFGTILKLNIDFEYLLFMLKNFTNFC